MSLLSCLMITKVKRKTRSTLFQQKVLNGGATLSSLRLQLRVSSLWHRRLQSKRQKLTGWARSSLAAGPNVMKRLTLAMSILSRHSLCTTTDAVKNTGVRASPLELVISRRQWSQSLKLLLLTITMVKLTGLATSTTCPFGFKKPLAIGTTPGQLLHLMFASASPNKLVRNMAGEVLLGWMLLLMLRGGPGTPHSTIKIMA